MLLVSSYHYIPNAGTCILITADNLSDTQAGMIVLWSLNLQFSTSINLPYAMLLVVNILHTKACNNILVTTDNLSDTQAGMDSLLVIQSTV